MIHAQTFQKLRLFIQGSKKAKITGIILKDITRMRPEGDDHAFIATPSSFIDQRRYDMTVPDVDTVEKSSSYNHFTNSKSCL